MNEYNHPAMQRFLNKKEEPKNTNEKLKEKVMDCPVCGMEPYHPRNQSGYTYMCCPNEDSYEYFELKQDAIDAWNRVIYIENAYGDTSIEDMIYPETQPTAISYTDDYSSPDYRVKRK